MLMTSPTQHREDRPQVRSRWLRHLLALTACAVLTHVAVVWAVPRVIMWRVMAVLPAESRAPGTVILPPLSDHHQRRVVMPSPDLLYALCVFDVSRQALRIRAHPELNTYWSIALYASNTDNFHVVGDRQTGGQAVDMLLIGPDGAGAQTGLPPVSTRVRAPATTGLLLMRLLRTGAESDLSDAQAARQTLRCEPIGTPG